MEFPIQELNSIFRFFHSILFIQFHSVYSIPFLEMATNLETSCNSKSRDMWSLLFIGFFSIQSDNFWEREIDSCTNMDKKKSSGAGQFLLKLSQTEWNGIYSIRNAIDSIRIFGPVYLPLVYSIWSSQMPSWTCPLPSLNEQKLVNSKINSCCFP